VTHEGDTVVVYVAVLGWGGLAVRYASILEFAAGRSRVATSLRRHANPAARDGALVWSSEPLGVQGTWRPIAPAVEQTILASRDGFVRWHCLQPAAQAALRVRDEQERPAHDVVGLGYAERVEMNIAPWRLPIRELHWGRFVSVPDGEGRHASLVWIDWRGEHSVRLAVHDGRLAPQPAVAEDRVALEDGTVLALGAREPLREGAIGTTVLAAVPFLRDTVPGRILGVRERKWRSRGVLGVPGRRSVEGWAIHEVVSWP
jgi:hypothetical protein